MTNQPDDWTEPGAHPVVEGVVRIPLPLPNDGLRAVNVYAVDVPDGIVLVDSGWALEQSREQLSNAFRQLGYGLSDIRRILVTHIHRDHYNQAVWLRREFEIQIGLSRDEAPSLRQMAKPGLRPLRPQIDDLRANGAAALASRLADRGVQHDASEWEEPDEWLEPWPLDLTRRSLDVVPTPGHTQGHVVFHDGPNHLLFAGDHVLPRITPSIGFEAAPGPHPLRDYLSSLAMVRRRPDAMLLPAHGPVTPSAHDRIDELLDHHDRRLDEIEATAKAGADTAAAIAGRLQWTRRMRQLTDLDDINQMLAVLETKAHLDVLVTQGRLTMCVEDDVRHYGPG